MKKLLFYISCVCLFVVCCTSCSSHSEEYMGSDTPILLSAQTADGVQARSTLTDGQALLPGMEVGVYITENGGTNLAIASNQKYEAVAGGLNVAGGAQSYYPASGNGVKMSAYYPHSNNASNAYDFKVAVDQSTDDSYNASDLLYSATANYTRQTAAHSLAFVHKLSRITYTLVPKEGAPSLANAVVRIVNVLPTVKFDRTNGSLTAVNGAKSTIVPHAKGAIVVPQTIAAASQLIKVTAGGNDYYYKPTEALSMESGKTYNFTIGVTGTQLQVTYTVSDWATGTVNDSGGAVSAYSYRLGDYYPNPNVDLTVQAEKDKIQGIVFWIDPAGGGKHGKIVSLNEGAGLQWGRVNVPTGASGDWDGSEPTKTIQAIANWETDYPVFNWVHVNKNNSIKLVDGGQWYIPGAWELTEVYAAYNGTYDVWNLGSPNPAARAAFNSKLTTAGGFALSNNYYWSGSESSSANAWFVYFSDGNAGGGSKSNNDPARAVRAF